MIGKEKFTELIQAYYKQDERVDKLGELFPNCYDSPIIEYGWEMFDELKNTYFDEDGVDWIDYFLYENPEKCYYQDDVKIPLETIDDLWEVIKDNRI